jgi:hypothetical protein
MCRLDAALTPPAVPSGRCPVASQRPFLNAPIAPSARAGSGARGDPMFDLLFLVLLAVLFAISIAMIRFFDRL